MRVKLSLIAISFLILYLMVPIGKYDQNDVVVSSYNTKITSLAKGEEFVSQVEENLNPILEYIVWPTTAVSRNGDNSIVGTLKLNSGYIRTGKTSYGDFHGGLDTGIEGIRVLGTCPAGRSSCADVALVAPISGTVSFVKSNNGNEAKYWNAGSAYNSVVKIKASGSFEGWEFIIYHLANIPDNIKEGYEIKQGEYIGTQCSQGNSTGSHVHMEIRAGARLIHVNEWFTKLTLHKSIGNMNNNTGRLSRDLQGWNEEDMDTVMKHEKLNSDVSIPKEFLVN